ncbi:MAG: tRNA pseudouridine(13) synthase TruD [Deltaproteobacteria bacterium]|nr:tRNA pseudouridine(13) synthase TruD [Deltaproteobacteria bacterium]
MSNSESPEQVSATLRKHPSDFVVDELPAYEACGEGDHLYLTFRKTGLTTLQVVRALAERLGVDPREVGFAGMKDRHAVTTQVASFPFASGRDPEEARSIELEGVTILEARRHRNKLRTGHLRGNRFTITLRDLNEAGRADVERRLDRVRAEGVPNAFGPQRFGRDGANPERALAWLQGKERPPRDKRERKLLFSALQSRAFNQVLARREAEGTWASILLGDLAQKHDSGGVFLVGEAELDDARRRATEGLISATGPMFGVKMRWPEGRAAELEREALGEMVDDPARLAAFASYGEGARRALRLWVDELTWTREGADALVVSFVLTKGGYATTVLSRACHLVDVSLVRTAPREDAAPDGSAEESTDIPEG